MSAPLPEWVGTAAVVAMLALSTLGLLRDWRGGRR